MKNICFKINYYKTDDFLVIVNDLRQFYSNTVIVIPINNRYNGLFNWFEGHLGGIVFNKFSSGLIYISVQCIKSISYGDPKRILRGNIDLLSSAFLTIKNA